MIRRQTYKHTIYRLYSSFCSIHYITLHYTTLPPTQALDYELKRAEVRETERVAREVELQTELEAAKQDMGTYAQVC